MLNKLKWESAKNRQYFADADADPLIIILPMPIPPKSADYCRCRCRLIGTSLIKIGIMAKSLPKYPGDHKWVRKFSPKISFPIPVVCRLDFSHHSIVGESPAML
jgi:hypothetical protein